jgi:hypothetical protein
VFGASFMAGKRRGAAKSRRGCGRRELAPAQVPSGCGGAVDRSIDDC